MHSSYFTRARRGLLLASLLALAIGLSACGGTSSSGAPADDPQAGTPVLTPQQRAAVEQRFAHALPAKAYAALGRLSSPARSAAFAQRGAFPSKQASVVLPFWLSGVQEYQPGVTEGGWVMLQHAADSGTFEMRIAPPSPELPDSFGYAIYRVDGVTAEAKSIAVSATEVSGEYGVGAYNYGHGSTGRWEALYYGSDASPLVDFEIPGADFTDEQNRAAIIVFALHPAAVDLQGFELRGEVVNNLPSASLLAMPTIGLAPLDVAYDASGSFDPDGGALTYRFDPEGDGTWVDNGSSPNFDFSNASKGKYRAMVEVTDEFGGTDTAAVSVIVGDAAYDEVENNDSLAEANALPSLPFEVWHGNIGEGGPMDGDIQDYYSLSGLGPGDVTRFELDYDVDAGIVMAHLNLYDADGDFLAQIFAEPRGVLVYEFQPADTAPYHLVIETEPGFDPVDYFISARPYGLWDEFEDNDTPAEYNSGSFADGDFVNWTGSLGAAAGYIANDGDRVDWIGSVPWDTYNVGDQIKVDLNYDLTTGDVDITLFNDAGKVLAASADTDGTEELSYTIAEGDTSPFRVRIEASGHSDYSVNARILTGGGAGYDEVEPNDTEPAANALPAVDFVDFKGNIGFGGEYNGALDWFRFDMESGTTRNFIFEFDNPTGAFVYADVYAMTEDEFGSFLDRVKTVLTVDGPLVVSYTPQADEFGPFYLVLSTSEGFEPADIDYTLAGSAGAPIFSEVEDNDSVAAANALEFILHDFGGELQGFSGSIGAGGSNYDSDGDDWYVFTLGPGQTGGFDCYFDPGTGAVATEITDGTGFALAESDTFGDDAYVEYTSVEGGTYYLHVLSESGFSDYWFQGQLYN